MTRLPSDSFLPSGAMEANLQLSLAGLVGSHAPSSSVISPLSLPGGVQYFDPMTQPSVTSHPKPHATSNHIYSPRSGAGSRDPPRAQPPSFLSPHLTPIPSHAQYQLQFQRYPQQRASSLSPTRSPSGRIRDGAMDRKIDAEINLPQRVMSSGVSVPVDTISGTGSGLITVRRPAMRTYPTNESTSTNSQGAATEQEYRRLERMRQAFDDERRYLQASRDRAEEVYKEIIDELEEDHARQRTQWEADKYELQTQIMQLQHRLQEVEPRGDGTSASDPKLATFQSGSSKTSPTEHSGLHPHFGSRENRSSTDSSANMEDLGLPSKVIDVQEYHKDLEGIHLKENFVMKETFTDTPSSSGSRNSSGKVSPPQNPEDARSLARARSIKALRADADSRLTMHAGHTPTVSLSIAHTGTSNTVVSSGSNTPTLTSGDGATSVDNKRESSEPAEPVPTGIDDDHVPAIMEPSDDDPELKGPLTLRNIPAKDEVFLRRLSDKLEKVTSGEDATPSVLKNSDDEDDGEGSETIPPAAECDSDAADTEDAEEDIPLKIRKTSSNFGKPFGVV